MFISVYKNSLKCILRSPVVYLSLIGVFFIWLNYTSGSSGSSLGDADRFILTVIINLVIPALSIMLPVFASTVCSVDILRDHKNQFYDIELTTKLKTSTFFIAKICSYITVCYAVLFVYITALGIQNFFFGQAADVQSSFDSLDIVWRIVRLFLAVSLPSVLTYISLSVFLSLAFKNPIAGILPPVIYSMSGIFFASAANDINNIWGAYLYPVSSKTTSYMYAYDSPYFNEYITKFQESPFGISMIQITSSWEVFLSHALIILISMIFLALGYIVLKRREA